MAFLKLYTDFAQEITDAPLEFSQFLGIATAGIAIGRSRWIGFGDQNIYPNFYMLILAPSSMYRKSTVLGISQRMLSAVNPLKVYPADFSQEKIMDVLKEQPSGAFYYYEFRSLMGLLSRDYMASAKSFLTELFDSNDMTMARKTGTFTVESPCVSILSATTSDWFVESIKAGDIEGGFLGRFLYIHSKKKLRDDAIPPLADPEKKRRVVDALSILSEPPVGMYREGRDGRMTISEPARKAYVAWYKQFVARYETMSARYRTLTARLNIYCLKIALVLETCSTGRLEIGEKAMEEAITQVNWLHHSVVELCEAELSFSWHEAGEKKIMKYVRTAGGKIERSKLLMLMHMPARKLGDITQVLLESGQLATKYEKIGQRETQFYQLPEYAESAIESTIPICKPSSENAN